LVAAVLGLFLFFFLSTPSTSASALKSFKKD
jgi:hypothetical protein